MGRRRSHSSSSAVAVSSSPAFAPARCLPSPVTKADKFTSATRGGSLGSTTTPVLSSDAAPPWVPLHRLRNKTPPPLRRSVPTSHVFDVSDTGLATSTESAVAVKRPLFEDSSAMTVKTGQLKGLFIRRKVELQEYGFTPGCPGCIAAEKGLGPRVHNKECRMRISNAMRYDPSDAMRSRVVEAEDRLSPPGLRRATDTDIAVAVPSSDAAPAAPGLPADLPVECSLSVDRERSLPSPGVGRPSISRPASEIITVDSHVKTPLRPDTPAVEQSLALLSTGVRSQEPATSSRRRLFHTSPRMISHSGREDAPRSQVGGEAVSSTSDFVGSILPPTKSASEFAVVAVDSPASASSLQQVKEPAEGSLQAAILRARAAAGRLTSKELATTLTSSRSRRPAAGQGAERRRAPVSGTGSSLAPGSVECANHASSACTAIVARETSLLDISSSSALVAAGAGGRLFTPECINPMQCLARTWAGGAGGQCTAARRKDGLCLTHWRQWHSSGRGLTHGRVDSDVPLLKLQEFERMQQKMLRLVLAAALHSSVPQSLEPLPIADGPLNDGWVDDVCAEAPTSSACRKRGSRNMPRFECDPAAPLPASKKQRKGPNNTNASAVVLLQLARAGGA